MLRIRFAIAALSMSVAAASSAATLASAQGTDQPGADPQALADLQSPPTLDERDRAIAAFSAAYLAGRYADALEPAQRVVAIGERLGLDAGTLGTAYNNLGTVQLQLQDLKAAEQSFRLSAALIERDQGDAAEGLIAPLGGLGMTLAAQQLYGNAVDAYVRALAISRRAKGLHNADQLGLIESLCTSLQAIGDLPGVDRERQYAIQVFEKAFGADDLRVVPSITTLAYWYEQTRRYQLARETHERALAIAEKAGAAGTPLAVNALRGVARSYRLAHAESPVASGLPKESEPRHAASATRIETRQEIRDKRVDGGTLMRQSPVRDASASTLLFIEDSTADVPPPQPEGRHAIERALDLVEAAPDLPPRLRAATLIDAADWYQTEGNYRRALPLWSAALPSLPRSELDGGNPMARPRLLVYHTPEQQVHNAELQYNRDATILDIEFSFTVTAEGKVKDVRVVRSDADPGQVYQATTALKNALYAPRFEEGRPVETKGVSFVSTWYRVSRPTRLSSNGSRRGAGND